MSRTNLNIGETYAADVTPDNHAEKRKKMEEVEEETN